MIFYSTGKLNLNLQGFRGQEKKSRYSTTNLSRATEYFIVHLHIFSLSPSDVHKLQVRNFLLKCQNVKYLVYFIVIVIG